MALEPRETLSVSSLAQLVYTCMLRPVCFPGAWRSWHLQVACLHLQCWTIYCYICHSSAFFLVSDRSGWNHPLREAPCRLNVDLFLERARLAPPSPLKSSHQYTASFYSLRDLSRFSSLSTLFLYFRFLNFIFFVLSVVSSFYYYPEAHATQRKLKLGASYDVHLPLFTI